MHEGAMKKKSAGQQCQDRCAEGSGSVIQGIQGTDPRIRICTKMSRIRNTALHAIGGGPFFWYQVMFACGWDLVELWMRSRRVWIRPSRGRMRSNRVWTRSKLFWMRSGRVVRESDCQCQSRNSPGFDPSILWHSGIWGEQMKQLWIKYGTLRKNNLQKIPRLHYLLATGVHSGLWYYLLATGGHSDTKYHFPANSVSPPRMESIPRLHKRLQIRAL